MTSAGAQSRTPLGAVLAAVEIWGTRFLPLVVAVFGWTLCERSITMADEGYLLLQSLEIANGEVLYRDLDSFVAPGVWFLLAGLFSLFEPSVWLSRVAVWVLFCVTAGLTFRIVTRLASRVFGLGAVCAYLTASVWAFPAWTFSFYSPYSIAFALLALDRLLTWFERPAPAVLVSVGLFGGLSVLFKQNTGAFALVAIFVGVVAAVATHARVQSKPLELLRSSVALGCGVLLVVFPTIGYFAWHGALGDVYQALLVRPFSDFVGNHSIPVLGLDRLWSSERMHGLDLYVYMASTFTATGAQFGWTGKIARVTEALHVGLYWIPWLAFALGGAFALRRGSRGSGIDLGLLSLVLVAAALFLGLFPRADFNHLMNVYQPIIILVAVLAHRVIRLAGDFGPTARGCVIGGLLVASALYASVGADWYFRIMRDLTTRINLPRGGVVVDRWQAEMIEHEVGLVQAATAPGEPVLTAQGLAMLNFLAERPVPGRHSNLYAVHIGHDEGAEVVEAVEREGVQVALLSFGNFFADPGLRNYAPKLVDHIRRNFVAYDYIGAEKQMLFRRRATPLPPVIATPLLPSCDLPDEVPRWRIVRDFLLYDSLFHRFNGESGKETTVCHSDVGASSTLAFAVGYKEPLTVSDGSTIVGEVWVEELDGTNREMLFRREYEVVPVDDWSSPPATEHRLDLARYAGRRVRIEFTTIFEGHASQNPLDLSGFGMFWHGVEVENPAK